MISSCEKAVGKHLGVIHCAFVACVLSDEMRIFITLPFVSFLYDEFTGAGQLKQMNLLFVIVQDHYIWFFSSHTYLKCNGASSRCQVSRQVIVNLEF